MIIECDAVKKDAPLRQGDIFKFLNKRGLWENLGVIITTDCDIVWDKNADVYSYCPITNLENYFKDIYLPKQIKLEKVLEKIKNMIDKHYNNKNNGVDIKNIRSWVKERGIDGALEDVDIKTDNMKNAISFLFNFDDESYSVQFYLKYKTIINPESNANNEIKKLERDFVDHIKKLPGDLFFINFIMGIDDYGFIVNLRRIGMFSRKEISISSDDNNKVCLKRIARMVPPFNYRLTQKVAQMFSDIGLPQEYEIDRINTIGMLFSTLRSEK
jgi:hypothetical protein